MNWVERLLIIGGVSLDVFAAMEREGSLVAKIEKKGLLSVCFLVCAWQAAALYAGNLAAAVILEKERSVWSLAVPGNGIMLAAFTWLGMHLAAGALHRERIYEHRAERFNRNGILRAMVRAGGYMLLAGDFVHVKVPRRMKGQSRWKKKARRRQSPLAIRSM